MIKVTTSVARKDFAAVLRKVEQGKRFLLKNHDKGVAAIVSVEDLALLEAIENRHDLEAARQALLEVAEKGAIPWEEAKKELEERTVEKRAVSEASLDKDERILNRVQLRPSEKKKKSTQ